MHTAWSQFYSTIFMHFFVLRSSTLRWGISHSGGRSALRTICIFDTGCLTSMHTRAERPQQTGTFPGSQSPQVWTMLLGVYCVTEIKMKSSLEELVVCVLGSSKSWQCDEPAIFCRDQMPTEGDLSPSRPPTGPIQQVERPSFLRVQLLSFTHLPESKGKVVVPGWDPGLLYGGTSEKLDN